MRVGFFGQSGPYAPVALRRLLAQVEPGLPFEMVLVVEGRRRSSSVRHRLRKAKPGPLGPGDGLGTLAVAAGIPVLETNDINGAGALRVLREFDLDRIVCVGFDRLFGAEVLASARQGGINAHPSRLPDLRGPSPLFWALKRGYRCLAVTLHALDLKEDHGPIFAQQEFELPARATGEELYGLAGQVAGDMLAAVLTQASQAKLIGTSQDHNRATRAPRPKPEDCLIEPQAWGGEDLVNFCCGAPYFRTPWMRLGGEVFFVRRGLKWEKGRRLPAEYAQIEATLIVQCRDGLAYLEIQL